MEERAVGAATRRQYRDLWNRFAAFTQRKCLATPTTPQLDIAVAEFLDELFYDGEPSTLASKVIAAIGFFRPEVGKYGAERLPRARLAAQGWRKTAPAYTRFPFTWEALMAVIGLQLHLGRREYAWWLLFTYEFYLRPSESLALLPSQLVPPVRRGARPGFWGILLAPQEGGRPSKVGDMDESVRWDKPSLGWAGPLFEQLKRKPSNEPIWSFTAAQALRWLKEAVFRLNLPYSSVSLYQLRHGGASNDRLVNYRSLKEIKARGRWTSDRSVRRYEKATRAQQLTALIPKEVMDWQERVERHLADYMLDKKTPIPAPAIMADL